MGRNNRTIPVAVLGVACAVGAVLALADVETPIRVILTPMFLFVVPGAAVVGLLRDRDPLSALTVGAAASLAVNVVLAEAMVLFDAWSPRAGVATVGILSFFLLVIRLLYRGNAPAERGTGTR
ncbi:hypothetical protein [Microtetraspora sp. NBRC 16547]|uniref:hypothetical protein n=1 Tax=Microtetraspora sp. NBRC 16547 TaxID=3030993 RepID=UPI0024A462EE|nr:hypothetical protein [Microtetraspora sp. NBRC 16547]GLW98713.1 hypothetical protein Misp02_28000 [Microtetraspora sp. NBRC 16547]